MNVAIVHYHLGHGGVPQTIRTHSRILARQRIPHVILAGSHLPQDVSLPVLTIPGLGYGDHMTVPHEPEELADEMIHAATRHLGRVPDLWHVHNHSLGKNPALSAAVGILAREGCRLLLHIHDLAEDGRPALYASIRRLDTLYPFSTNVHYAFLNQRDRSVFVAAGLPESQSHILEGLAQSLPETSTVLDPPSCHSAPLLFAPVRGIRRKNLGELVLLSVLLPPARIAISRPPADPTSLAIHNRWQAFASIHAPRVDFAVTGRIPPHPDADASFETWVHHATHIIGTSVAEGFGLSFLEAREWGKPFVGRRLSHLRHLAPPDSCYDRLLIPHDWIAGNILREHLESALSRDDRTRCCHPRLPHLAQILADLTADGMLDFGNLPECLQQSVIERCSDPSSRGQVFFEIEGSQQPAVPWLHRKTMESPVHPGTACLPDAPSRPLLLSVYDSVISSPASTNCAFLPLEPILRSYHTPRSFHFLTAPPPPHPHRRRRYHVVLFDIYDTLLHTRSGPVRPDPKVDGQIADVIRRYGHQPPESPTRSLHHAVVRHHAASSAEFPEVDLRVLWSEILGIPPDSNLDDLVIETEGIRSPCRPVAGGLDAVRHLAAAGVRIGLLSNAQCNALPSLAPIADLFDPGLIVLSYQFGHAKPSTVLFDEMARRINSLGIAPDQVLFIGNSPAQDIAPAQRQGWHTAHFADKGGATCPATFRFARFPSLLSRLETES